MFAPRAATAQRPVTVPPSTTATREAPSGPACTAASATTSATASARALRTAASGREDLTRLFAQIQLEAALQGGGLNPASRAILARMCDALGITALEFAAFEAMARMRSGAGAGTSQTAASASSRLADSYQVLGVAAEASDAKLVANGLPESMIEAAHERTRRILEAYELIRTHRGMK